MLDTTDIRILKEAFVDALKSVGVGEIGSDFSSRSTVGSRTRGESSETGGKIPDTFTAVGENLNDLVNMLSEDIKKMSKKEYRDTSISEARRILSDSSYIGGASDAEIKRAEKYIEALEKISEDTYQAEKNRLDLELEVLETNANNRKYSTEQNAHNAKLYWIEAQVREKHLDAIKELFKREEEIRANGLQEHERKQNLIDKQVELTSKDVYTKDGKLSVSKDLMNRVILAPLQKTLLPVFGSKKHKLGATQTLGTTVAKAVASGLSGASKLMSSVSTGKMNVSGMLGNASSALMKTGNPYAMAAGAVIQILKTAFEMYSKVDKAASDYARKVGGGAVAQVKMRKTAADLAVEMGKFGERTYNAETILANMAETSEALGRNLEYLSTLDLKAINDLKDFGINGATISQFDTFGVSIERVSREIGSLYGTSGKKGLNASTVIKSVSDNLKLAQNYTFEKGRKAIYDMAEKAAQLKFNIRDAASFADKVGTLEGAMKSAAQLSVLGGSFAMQGNPMTLLYNALNDVEGLQDQMLAMTKDMAHWDSRKGQFEISAFDRQRLKAMSEATGIGYDELTTQANTQARVARIASQIKPGTDKETADYLKNIAFIDENGDARVQFHDKNGKNDGEAKLLSKLTEEDKLRLKGESEAKDIKDNASVGDILSSTRSIQDQLDDLVNQVKNYLVKGVMRLVERFSSSNKLKSMYNFDDDERFERVRSKLSNGTLKTSDFKDATAEEKKIYQKMGILDEKGNYKGRSTDERYGRSFLGLWGGDLYGNNEIAQMYIAATSGDQKKPKAYSNGGYTGDGGPNEIAGLVHKGEYVIDAETTKSMMSGVKNGENPMNFKNFGASYMSLFGRMGNGMSRRANDFIDGTKTLKVEFGTLRLELGGVTKDIDVNAFANVLLSNSSFIEGVMRQISSTRSFGYNKEESNFQFAERPYSNTV